MLFFLLLTSCGVDGYKIKGRITGVPDGTMVYMSLVNDELTEVDSAVVRGERFEFNGRQDSASMRMIYSYVAMNGGPIVLENGTINVLMDKEIHRTGTKLNDELQYYISCEEELFQRRMLVATLEKMGGVDTSRLDSMRTITDIAHSGFVNAVYDIVKNNIDNALGVYVITKSGDMLPPYRLHELMTSVPEHLRNEQFENVYSQVQMELDNIKRAELTSVGKHYFNFELPDIYGKKVLFSNIVEKSRFTLLDFWASWCPPCRMEMPKIKSLFDTYAQRGLAVVSVSLDSDTELWREAVGALGMNWVQLCDPSRGSTELAFAYGVKGIPTLLLIGNDGKIVLRGNSIDDMVAKIEVLLK